MVELKRLVDQSISWSTENKRQLFGEWIYHWSNFLSKNGKKIIGMKKKSSLYTIIQTGV